MAGATISGSLGQVQVVDTRHKAWRPARRCCSPPTDRAMEETAETASTTEGYAKLVSAFRSGPSRLSPCT